MSDSSPELPEVEPRDPEPVAVAIETARALYRSGDQLDALRWLRRAAERAEESGDDLRAVHLARSAADLSTALQSVPPPPTSRRHDEAAALAPYDDFSDKTVVDAAAAPLVRESLQSGVQITELPSPSASARHSVTMPSPPSSTPKANHAPLVASVAKPAVRAAVRVAVAHNPEHPGSWLVRPLSDDAALPSGFEEALLIALDPSSRLLQ